MLKPLRGQSHLGPTIPSKGNLGYIVNAETKIATKILPLDAKSGFLLIEPELNSVTKKYKGIFWSKRTCKRDVTAVTSKVPAPNAYNVVKTEDTLRDMLERRARPLIKRTTKDRRYIDKLTYDAARNNIPGPGHYNIEQRYTLQGMLMKSEKLLPCGYKSLGPRDYNRTNISAIKSVIQKKYSQKVPFLSSAPRFN